MWDTDSVVAYLILTIGNVLCVRINPRQEKDIR
jgi:hypothetical protein